jgi:hypothetical protein
MNRLINSVFLGYLIITTGAFAVSPPTLNSPGSSSSPGPVLTTLTPTFSWNAASGATGYGLYIRDVTTGNLIYPNASGTTTTPLTGTSFTLPSGYLVNGNSYRWDMTSFTGSTEGSVSSLLYFQAPAAIAGPPTLNSPGSSSSPGPVLTTLTPTFSWNAASGATGYGLYIRDVTTGNLIYPNASGTTTTPLTGTSFTLPSGYLVNGDSYRWDMTSFTGSTEGSVSSLLYFQAPGTAQPYVLGADFNTGGGAVAWPEETSDGRSFAYIKATQDNFNNHPLPSNLSVKPSNFSIGLFDYADPDDYYDASTRTFITIDPTDSTALATDAMAEADFFYQTTAPYLTTGNLIPALDLEDDEGNGGFSAAWTTTSTGWTAMANWINIWTEEFQTHMPGIYPILYMTQSYAGHLAPLLDQSRYRLWIAIAGTGTQYSQPQVPPSGDLYWNPTVWPWVIEQYQTTSTSYPPDLDVLNPDLTLDSLQISSMAAQNGSLQVAIIPQAAVVAGAKWQVDSGQLQSSGIIVSNLSSGSHTVSFTSINGWTSPANQTVIVNPDSTAIVSGTYVIIPPPQIQVTTGPCTIINNQILPINFGTVEQGQIGQTVTFTIRNTGQQNLNLGTITVPTGYSIAQNPPSAVSPGNQCSLVVQLESATLGTASGPVNIPNNDPNDNPFIFQITGAVTTTSQPPQTEVQAADNTISNGQSSPINFGTVQEGEAGPTLTFFVNNTGGQTLNVGTVNVPPGYTVTQDLPASLAPGELAALVIQLNSGAAGTESGSVSIANSDPNNDPFTFQITGIVSSVPMYTITTSLTPTNSGMVSGSGTFAAGTRCTVTAMPNSGYTFANWSENDVVVSTLASYTFTIDTNHSLIAVFYPLIVPPVKGVYSGLFYEEAGPRLESSGYFSIATTAKGKFSGNLNIAGTRVSVSGQLDSGSHKQITVERRGQNPLILTLQIGPADADEVTGTVSADDGSWTAELSGNREVFSNSNPAPQAGKYTMIFPGTHGQAAEPGGYGCGTISLANFGIVQLSGLLADGTKITQTAPLSRHGMWPLYAPLYGRQGFLLGWITFAATPTNDFSGYVVWTKPNDPVAKYYPKGFSIRTVAEGSRYTRPSAGHAILNIGSAEIVLTGGDWAQSLTNNVTIESNGRTSSPANLKLIFALSTGAFHGSVTDPNNPAAKPAPFAGVVFQKENDGYGSFMAPSGSGEVYLGQ